MGNRSNKPPLPQDKPIHQVQPKQVSNKEEKHVESEVKHLPSRNNVLQAPQGAHLQGEKYFPFKQPTASAEQYMSSPSEALQKCGHTLSKPPTFIPDKQTFCPSETLQTYGYIHSQEFTSPAERQASYQRKTSQKVECIPSQQLTPSAEGLTFQQLEILQNVRSFPFQQTSSLPERWISDQSQTLPFKSNKEIMTVSTTERLENNGRQNKHIMEQEYDVHSDFRRSSYISESIASQMRQQEMQKRMSYFPYKSDTFGKSFQEVIERSGVTKRINMMHLDRNCAKIIKIKDNEGDELYFHGTDAQSAKCILENGIDLNKSHGRHDFSCGYGFYLTPTLQKAMEWANRKSENFPNNAAAVIVFKVHKTLVQKMLPLSLEVKTDSGRKQWEAVISHFQNGEDNNNIASLLSGVKVIRGPVSKYVFLRPGETYTPDNFLQLCLRDDDCAKQFGDLKNVCCVFFFSELPQMFDLKLKST